MRAAKSLQGLTAGLSKNAPSYSGNKAQFWRKTDRDEWTNEMDRQHALLVINASLINKKWTNWRVEIGNDYGFIGQISPSFGSRAQAWDFAKNYMAEHPMGN